MGIILCSLFGRVGLQFAADDLSLRHALHEHDADIAIAGARIDDRTHAVDLRPASENDPVGPHLHGCSILLDGKGLEMKRAPCHGSALLPAVLPGLE